MGKRFRDRKRARRRPYRDAKPLILIITEGKVTEPDYLDGFAKACENPRVRIEMVEDAGDPRAIVRAAKSRKLAAERRSRQEQDDNLKYDQVWCVFDVDEHAHRTEAKQTATKNGLSLAVSNPCFELWLWLHFADQPGMQTSQDLRKMMKRHVSDYDKGVNYADYAAGYEAAVVRASRLDDQAIADSEEGRNPTTGVWKLTENIRSDL